MNAASSYNVAIQGASRMFSRQSGSLLFPSSGLPKHKNNTFVPSRVKMRRTRFELARFPTREMHGKSADLQLEPLT